jgi:hypothetical protein
MPDKTSTGRTDSYAIASLLSGITSWFFGLVVSGLGFIAIGLSIVTSLFGVSIGVFAVYIASKKPAQRTIRRTALTGIIISFLGILPLLVYLPSILDSITAVGHAEAFSSLIKISNAELDFKAKRNRYGTLEELADEGLISFELAKGNDKRYQFELTQIGDTFEIFAIPQRYHAHFWSNGTGRYSFYMDGSGKIHRADKNGEKANINDPLDEAYQER